MYVATPLCWGCCKSQTKVSRGVTRAFLGGGGGGVHKIFVFLDQERRKMNGNGER